MSSVYPDAPIIDGVHQLSHGCVAIFFLAAQSKRHAVSQNSALQQPRALKALVLSRWIRLATFCDRRNERRRRQLPFSAFQQALYCGLKDWKSSAFLDLG